MPATPGADGLAAIPGLAVPDLVGRVAEVAAVRRAVGGNRLVTVTGLPGAGKTAVALAAAGAAAAGFADGSLLLPLEGLRDEALLPHTIAAALELPDDFARGRLPVLAGQLRDRHLLRQDALDVCASGQLPAETVAAGLSLLAERSVLLASQRRDESPCYLLPATLRAYGRRMLRRLGQEEEFTARHQRWQDGRRPAGTGR